MITAQSVRPTKVGVAPGTTTFTLGDPSCDSGPRGRLQRWRLMLQTRSPGACMRLISTLSPFAPQPTPALVIAPPQQQQPVVMPVGPTAPPMTVQPLPPQYVAPTTPITVQPAPPAYVAPTAPTIGPAPAPTPTPIGPAPSPTNTIRTSGGTDNTLTTNPTPFRPRVDTALTPARMQSMQMRTLGLPCPVQPAQPGEAGPHATVYSPYANFARLNGIAGWFARRRARKNGLAGPLGYRINTNGYDGPTPANATTPYGEIAIVTKQAVWQNAYCGQYDKQYHERGNPGMYYDTQLGRIPSDLELSRSWGFVPMTSGVASFRQQAWAPLPWVARIGTWTPEGIRPWAPPFKDGRVLRGVGQEIVEDVAPAPMDPAQAAVFELKRHQDRVFALSVVSAIAIASTAMINVFKYMEEKRAAKRKSAPADSKPASITTPVAGARRYRRR